MKKKTDENLSILEQITIVPYVIIYVLVLALLAYEQVSTLVYWATAIVFIIVLAFVNRQYIWK